MESSLRRALNALLLDSFGTFGGELPIGSKISNIYKCAITVSYQIFASEYWYGPPLSATVYVYAPVIYIKGFGLKTLDS